MISINYKKLYYFTFFLFFIILNAHARKNAVINLNGSPEIKHFTRADFNADPQFWVGAEDKNGILYFGNNDGAVVFDGERWYKIFLPNNSSVRSLTVDEKGNVYAGGYNEMGQIKKDKEGRYYYESFIGLLQLKEDNLENLWQVHAIDGYVIYRSFSKLVAIQGKKVTYLPAFSSFIRSFIIKGQFFVHDRDAGILALNLENFQFNEIFSADKLKREEIVALFPTPAPDELVAFTKSGKQLKLNKQNKEVTLIKNLFPDTARDEIVSGIKSSNGYYFLGTLSSRIIACNENGMVNKSEYNFQGLQDKTVLNLLQLKSGNIWAMLNKGLDFIDFNSPITTLYSNASIYDVLLTKNQTFLATNQGVIYTDLSLNSSEINIDFQKVAGLEGQAWALEQIEEDVLVAHDKGLFKIKNNEKERIGNIEGIWKVIPVKGLKHKYLACSYNGMFLLERDANGNWSVLRKIDGFNESSRDIIEGDVPDSYFICHGYKGVYRVQIDPGYKRVTSLEHYTTQNGLPSPFNVNVFEWKGNTVFTTNAGLYSYNARSNSFIPFKPLNDVLDTALNTRKLIEFGKKTWFVQDDEVGFFETDDPDPILNKEIFLQFKGTFNRGMECLLPLDNHRILFGTIFGLYLFDLKHNNAEEVQTLITSVRYTLDDRQKWLPINSQTSAYQLPYPANSLRFEFTLPGIQDNAEMQYSYKLDNADKSWSSWSTASYKEYNHLRPGEYIFRVRGRTLLGVTGKETIYTFQILPPWYMTLWAWTLYVIVSVILIFLLISWIKRKIAAENQKTRKEEQRARKLLELELEQMKLNLEKEKIKQDKEQLEEDVIYKSKELANYTMLLVRKREVFSEIREELKDLKELSKTDKVRTKATEIIKKISAHLTNEEYLKVFEANFEKVHKDFFNKLVALYPDLTQKELRLCAFVKMNLSNKEIAPILNISIRGIETARYRLRKKLNLEHEHNMVEFLEKLSPSSYNENFSGDDPEDFVESNEAIAP